MNAKEAPRTVYQGPGIGGQVTPLLGRGIGVGQRGTVYEIKRPTVPLGTVGENEFTVYHGTRHTDSLSALGRRFSSESSE